MAPQEWSDEGCKLNVELSNGKQTVCECDHLTSFNLMMDFTGEALPYPDLLTNVLLPLSVVSLILCEVGEQQPAQLAGAEGQVPQAFHPSSMLATCHQRFLALHVGRLETVEELTKDEGHNGERKKNIGEQVTIGKCLAGEVHHQVEAGEVVAVTHGLLSVAQPDIQLATLLGPFL